MKKNILKIAFVAAFTFVVGYGVYTAKAETALLSDIALDNVEALAGGETETCPKGCVSGGSGCYCNGGWHSYCQESN